MWYVRNEAIVSARILISSCKYCPHCFRQTLARSDDTSLEDDGTDLMLKGYFCNQVPYDPKKDSWFDSEASGIIEQEGFYDCGYSKEYKPIGLNIEEQYGDIKLEERREDWKIDDPELLKIRDWCPHFVENYTHYDFDFEYP